jgi:hypothetical protein
MKNLAVAQALFLDVKEPIIILENVVPSYRCRDIDIVIDTSKSISSLKWEG